MRDHETKRKAMQYAGIGVLILAMLATYYLPDLIYDAINTDPVKMLVYGYFMRFGLLYICLFIMAAFYVVNLIIKIVKKKLPKDFFKPGKMILRVALTAVFAFLTVLFITDTSATLADVADENVYYEEIAVIQVQNSGGGTRYVEYDPDTGVTDAPFQTCYVVDGLTMESGNVYKFRVFKHTGTKIAVEWLRPTPQSGGGA